MGAQCRGLYRWGSCGYYDEYGLSVLCIRMGHVSASGKPGWGSNYEDGNPASLGRDISIYTSHRDIAQMVRKCVEAPDSVGFDVFYALSNNKRGYRDIQHTKDVIDFDPQDSAEDYYHAFPIIRSKQL